MAQASKKITERLMDRYGHVRRDEEHISRKVLRADMYIGPTREKEERATENKLERRVPTRLEKCRTDSG